jgi:hypothetical protein
MMVVGNRNRDSFSEINCLPNSFKAMVITYQEFDTFSVTHTQN